MNIANKKKVSTGSNGILGIKLTRWNHNPLITNTHLSFIYLLEYIAWFKTWCENQKKVHSLEQI